MTVHFNQKLCLAAPRHEISQRVLYDASVHYRICAFADALLIRSAIGPTESAALDAGDGEWSAQLCVCVNECERV